MSNRPGLGGEPPVPVERAAPIWTLVKNVGDAPDGVASEQNSSIVLLAGEFRQSCQQTAMLPERRLDAIRGRNMLRIGAGGLSLTWIGPPGQVAPLSSEKRTMTFVWLLPR